MASTHTDQAIASLLAEESDAIEENRDAPIPEKTSVTRGHGRSKVLQIRLNEEELAELERVAESRGLPPSTVAREAILRQLFPEFARGAEAARLIDQFAQFVLGFGAPSGDEGADVVVASSKGPIIIDAKSVNKRSSATGQFVTASSVRRRGKKASSTLTQRDAKAGRREK